MNWWKILEEAGLRVALIRAILDDLRGQFPDAAGRIDEILAELNAAPTPENLERLITIVPAQAFKAFKGEFDPRQPSSGFA